MNVGLVLNARFVAPLLRIYNVRLKTVQSKRIYGHVSYAALWGVVGTTHDMRCRTTQYRSTNFP